MEVRAVAETGMKDARIRYLGDVQRLQVKPGDVVVLSLAEPREDIEAIRRWLEAIFDDRVRALVLRPGDRIGVMGGEG